MSYLVYNVEAAYCILLPRKLDTLVHMQIMTETHLDWVRSVWGDQGVGKMFKALNIMMGHGIQTRSKQS